MRSPTELPTPADREPRGLAALLRDRSVGLLLVCAALVRIVVGLQLFLVDPLTTTLLSDAAYYDRWAQALASGEQFEAGLACWLPPLYPWALSLLYRLTGGAVGATLLAQGLLGLANTLLVVGLCERAAGRRAGLAAGWLWTLYLPVIFFETRLLAVNAALLPSLLALWTLVGIDRTPARAAPLGRSVLAGLWIGLASLARPNLLLAAPAAALWLALRGRASRGARPAGRQLGAALLLGLGCGIGLLPSLVHNWRQSGEPIPITANGGVNFWFGNNPRAKGTFYAPDLRWSDIEQQRSISTTDASAALGRPASAREASRHWFGRGLDWLAGNPGAGLRLWGRKLGDSLSSTEYGIQYVPAAHRTEAASLWIPCLPFGLLLLLAALGWRGEATGRGALIAWLAAGLAASLLYFTYSRLRLPLLPALMPFAGRGLARLLDALGGGERPGLAALGVGLILCAQSFIHFEGDYPAWQRSNAYQDMAARVDPADPQASQRVHHLLERALGERPDNVKALFLLGARQLEDGDAPAARRTWQEARADGHEYPDLHWSLAVLCLTAPDERVRDPQFAVHVLRSWLERQPPDAFGREDIQAMLAAALVDHPKLASDPREARRLAEQVRSRDPDHATANLVLQRLDGLLPPGS